ncbi:MAG TPA: GNAT family N-acetyltransferase, partial [Solirubrobacteraceae bacterium]|nr:GNAT family N-acetyltransferase [Solirubrobacteraceae bacterium]
MNTRDVSAAYPRDREAEIVLRDGSTVHVRPVSGADKPAIREFLDALSPEAIGFRFFGMPSLDWVTDWAVDVDYADRFALVAESGSPHRIIAHAAYARGPTGRAEIAFLVADAWQGKGISTVLLAHLAEVAERQGIVTFTAQVLPANHRMIEVFRESGFPVRMRSTPDSIDIELPTSLSAESAARFEERERIGAVAAVRNFLEPRSVAVIGASRRRGTVGGEILHNLLSSQFSGAVYAVNEQAEVVQSLPAYGSVGAIGSPVELAVVVVPAAEVVAVARECAGAGVGALLVISAGFAETGAAGTRRQDELVAVCRDSGMRLVGPNCLGVLNTAPEVSLNATFAPHRATPGRVGFMSQSGGVGIAIIEAAGRLGIGLSSFVSVGNRADLSGNDFLCYWEQDAGTDLALMYLESFGNPRKFARIAPRFARRKPLLAVKSGRSPAGARATSSHTGALLAVSDVTVDALFEQAGVIRTDTLHELFGVGALLTSQPVPRGDRVAIVTNAGGPGVLCADACQADGVRVPKLPASVQGALAAFLPAAATLANPVDMIASASAEDYRRTLRTLLDAEACDAILTIFVPPLVTAAADVATAIREVAASAPSVPIASVFMTSEGPPAELGAAGVRVPGYEFPEDAARALALAAKYGRWRARPEGVLAPPARTHPESAAAITSRGLAAGAGWLDPASVSALLECYGLPLIASRVVPDAEGAAAAAAEIGGPVALKASAAGLVHKIDVGGVRLGLEGRAEVVTAAREMESALANAGFCLDGLIVQPMAPPGVELIVGVVNDHSFGPVLACGAGGTTAELLRDVAMRITPLAAGDAQEMLRSLRTFPLLDGYRGAPPCDLAAVEDVLLRVSAMVEAHPEIEELDCNPLIAGPDG